MLVLQTIYVLNKEILQFFGLKSAVYNYERFEIKSGHKYGTLFFELSLKMTADCHWVRGAFVETLTYMRKV